MTPRTKDITGETFGKLTVLSYAGTEKKGALWLCRCACGNERQILGTALRSRRKKSCGCLNKQCHIDSDIEALNVNSRKRLKLQRRRDGLCISCGAPATRRNKRGQTKVHCSTCGARAATWKRAKRPATRLALLASTLTLLPRWSA